MKASARNRKHRLLMMALIMMAALVLCGCRTRITNNTEVENVMTDDSGTMAEEYQMRRDELGSPVAVPPILKGGSPEDYEDYEDYEYYDESFDDAEYYEDETYVDEPETENDSDSSSTVKKPSAPTPSRPTKPSSPSKPQEDTGKIKVSLDANGGKCGTASVEVTKDKTYGSLPSAEREGYDFTGWYTEKEDGKGSQIGPNTKVTNSKPHTLYAHWKEAEPAEEEFFLTFEAGADDVQFTTGSETGKVIKGGNYEDLPTVVRDGYLFDGWYTEAEGGKRVSNGDKFKANADQTLYAHWKEDPYASWNNSFMSVANEITDGAVVYIEDADDKDKSFVGDCRGSMAKESGEAQFIVKFIKNYGKKSGDELNKDAVDIYDKFRAEHPDTPVTVILMSDDAIKGSDKQKLIYKMMLMEKLYGNISEDEIDQAAADLEAEVTYPLTYPEDGEIPEVNETVPAAEEAAPAAEEAAPAPAAETPEVVEP